MHYQHYWVESLAPTQSGNTLENEYVVLLGYAQFNTITFETIKHMMEAS